MKKTLQSFVIAGALLSSTALTNVAQAKDFAVGANLSSQVLGLEARAKLMDNLFIRGGANYFSYTHSNDKLNFDISDAAPNSSAIAKAEFTLLSVPVIIDFHPIENVGLRLSAGVAYNGNKIRVEPTGAVFQGKKLSIAEYKDATNTAFMGQAVDLSDTYAELTPGGKIGGIVSVGYDDSLLSDSMWTFNAELGAMYAGPAKVKTQVNKSLDNAKARKLVKSLEKKAKSAYDRVGFYPIASIGFKYNF